MDTTAIEPAAQAPPGDGSALTAEERQLDLLESIDARLAGIEDAFGKIVEALGGLGAMFGGGNGAPFGGGFLGG